MSLFSRRTGWDTAENAFAAAIARERASGRPLLDLIITNPTQCGFTFDVEAILAPLANPASLLYDAAPRGLLAAREAVCRYYAEHNAAIAPDQVLLTASTSEAYGFLFRLLCDAGDEILVPQPGYPLFDYLADLEDVTLRSYPLFHDFGWWIDFAELERRIGPRTRAILLVHPANPTGHWTHPPERARLEEICARHRLALIVDEVFLDYSIAGESPESFATAHPPCLTFILSGLSKIAALPQMKIAWIVLSGPPALYRVASARLEVIADTFLSVATPAQHALPAWLAGRASIQRQILARTRRNLDAANHHRIPHLPVEAGWSLVVSLPAAHGGPEQILAERAVILHPGTFYGLPQPGRFVLSLIGDSDVFAQAMALLAS